MSEHDAELVTVVVAHVEPLLRRGVVDALREDRRVRVVPRHLEKAAFERDVARQGPRVVILGETVEYALLVRLRAGDPAPGVIVLADRAERLTGELLLAAGASYLARAASHADLLEAVHLAASGKPTFFCADGNRMERSYPSDLRGLTEREMQVLECLSDGRSNPEMADALHISVETVRTHVARVLRKLGVSSRRELIGMPVPRRRNAGR
jgi:DNA-binding NarL/FixJ family response regulator